MNMDRKKSGKDNRNITKKVERTGVWLTERVTPRRLAGFLTALYLGSLIPLLWIGWYNYPSADDYSIGSNCRHAWVSTHSVFSVLLAGIVRAVEDWVSWMGYFTSNFLMALPPSTFGERAYVVTTWIMLLMLSLSTAYLLHGIFVKVFGADKYRSRCVIMLMLLVTVQCMVGRVEAFYWYCGAVNYMFVHGMSLFFYGLLISAVYDKGKKRAIDLAAASVLGFFTGGGNQMTALNGMIVLAAAAALAAFSGKWRQRRGLAVPMGLYVLGFLLNVGSPGNWVRAGEASGMNPVKAVFISFYYCLDYCMNEWSGWPVALLVIALVPLFYHMAGGTRFQFRYPLAVALFGYCVVSAMMTPPLFAVGNMEAARLQALTFTMYILVLTLSAGYVTGWARKRIEALSGCREEGGTDGRFSPAALWCLLGCFLFFGAAAAVTVIPEPHYFTASSAVTDLANGSARVYGTQRRERMELYLSGETDVVVEPLSARPALLYFSDIKPDPQDWENRGLCRFYGIDSVRVKEEQ